jgi:hypothetical protein
MPKTGFQPEKHGFAFVNSWSFTPQENTRLRDALNNSTDSAANSIGGFGMGAFLQSTIGAWLDEAMPDTYGLCGGMAFTAADYYRAGRELPRGVDYNDIPDSDSPQGLALRDHLWRRQIESLGPNGPILLAWMAMLHLPLPFAGPDWLLARTREQWAILKRTLDNGDPWPICLIGTSLSPFNNHQVLAVGYEDNADGTGMIMLYDMNCPGREQVTRLDFRGTRLQAEESCPSPERGTLCGFFCEHYVPAPPPELPE